VVLVVTDSVAEGIRVPGDVLRYFKRMRGRNLSICSWGSVVRRRASPAHLPKSVLFIVSTLWKESDFLCWRRLCLKV
jgi:hypothetical protein